MECRSEIWRRKVKIEIAIAPWYSVTRSPFNTFYPFMNLGPGSCYPNWTAAQVEKCRITKATRRLQSAPCVSHYVDDRGHFINVKKFEAYWPSGWVDLSLLCERLSVYRRQAPILVTNKSHLLRNSYLCHDRFDIEPSFLRSSIGFLPGLKLISNQESEIVWMFCLLNTCFAERHIYDRSHNYSYISALCLC